jgi:hypothetical protein
MWRANPTRAGRVATIDGWYTIPGSTGRGTDSSWVRWYSPSARCLMGEVTSSTWSAAATWTIGWAGIWSLQARFGVVRKRAEGRLSATNEQEKLEASRLKAGPGWRVAEAVAIGAILVFIAFRLS